MLYGLLPLRVHLGVEEGGVALDDLGTNHLHGSGHQAVFLSELLGQDDELAHGLGAGDALVGLIDPLLHFGAHGGVLGGILQRHVLVQALGGQPRAQRLLVQRHQCGDERTLITQHQRLGDELATLNDFLDRAGGDVLTTCSDNQILLTTGDVQEAIVVNHHDPDKKKKVRISKLYEFDGLNKVDVAEAGIGSIVAISGIADIHIGDTICSVENPVAIPFQKISEPTLSMNFIVNDSPLAGQEGKFITSRHLRDRLFRELNTDVSLRVEETDSPDSFKVSGRGELHLSVLIENMRREGYEFAVSKAEVLYHTDENGKKLEPMELAYVDVPDEFTGAVIDKLSQRKGEMLNMKPLTGGYTRLEFNIPSRGLIGYRGEFMTDTRGNGIINTIFNGYDTYRGDIAYRQLGSLIAFESGESVTYGLFSAQDRGTLFIGPGEKVYAGMVIGSCSRNEDIELNVCKKKHLTNTRSSSADEALTLVPPKILSLEQALDFIDVDELLEVTPVSLRIRKRILDPTLRKRANFKK